jgi:hypothetical protein
VAAQAPLIVRLKKMTLKINYLENGKGIEIIASGTVTGSEIIARHDEIYSPKNLARQRYQIIDRTQCKEYIVSFAEVQIIAEIDKKASKTNPEIIIVIVAPTDLQFGMSRVWQAYVEESRFLTKVFRERTSAEGWLKERLHANLTKG